MEIYIHRDGQQFGPYSLEQARKQMASGELLPTDLAWREGAADWAPLAEVVIVTPVVPPLPPASPAMTQTSAGTPPAQPEEAAADLASGKGRRMKRRRSPSGNPITRAQRAVGIRNISLGALWFIGGTAVTIYSYEAASDSGGTYWVTWGAILFGGIQLLKGIIQYTKA